VTLALPWPRLATARPAVARRIDRPRTLHVLGDSHATLFERLSGLTGLRRTRVVVHNVNGATATGLPNPNSATQAGPTFRRLLAELEPADDLLFCLGEVDCGFAIWYRAQKHGLTIDGQLDRAITHYAALLDAARVGRTGQVLVATAVLPTIRDGVSTGAVANKRREVRATLRERTALTHRFNDRLRDLADDRGLPVLDLTGPTLDPDTGVVHDRYRHADPSNHHLHPRRVRPALLRGLRRLGYA
jgi:hypothetical protein